MDMGILSVVLLILIGEIGLLVVHVLAFFIALILEQGDTYYDSEWAYYQAGIKKPYLIRFQRGSWAQKTCFFRLRVDDWEFKF